MEVSFKDEKESIDFNDTECEIILRNMSVEEKFRCRICHHNLFKVRVESHGQGIHAHITCARCACEHLCKGEPSYLMDSLYCEDIEVKQSEPR